MKTVFSNEMVAHVWAQQNQSHGRNSGNTLFFEHTTIYSYGYHFPIAKFATNSIGKTIVLFNDDSYSSTTSNHQNYCRNAIDKNIPIINVPKWAVERLSDTQDDLNFNKVVNWFNGRAKELISRARNARKWGSYHLGTLDKLCNDFKMLCSWMMIDSYDLAISNGLLNSERESIDQKTAEYLAKKEQRRKEKLKVEQSEKRQQFNAWLDGKDVDFPYCFNPDDGTKLLSINRSMGEIRTSGGATFPIEHGKRAWKRLKAIRSACLSNTKLVDQKINEFQIKLGAFKIGSIDDAWTVKAGCHRIKWEEIERIGQQLENMN